MYLVSKSCPYLLKEMADTNNGHMTVAAASVVMPNVVLTFQHPFVEELPRGLMQIISADPTGPIAAQYRMYIEKVFLPDARRASMLIEAQASVLLLPPNSVLAEAFPKIKWDQNVPSVFLYNWHWTLTDGETKMMSVQ